MSFALNAISPSLTDVAVILGGRRKPNSLADSKATLDSIVAATTWETGNHRMRFKYERQSSKAWRKRRRKEGGETNTWPR